MIPHSKPFTGQKELKAVRRVITSGQLAQGREVEHLEHELCSYVGHRFGLAVSSGTTALFGALNILDVGPGDKVVIPSFACTALANAVYMCGAQPVLCDVENANGLMSVKTVRKALVKKVRAVIVPHLFGFPAPASDIESNVGLPVVEDCAQCIGTEMNGKKVGAQTTIAIFSFYATKVICAGEGGLIATSDSRLARRLEELREYDNCIKWKPQINMKCSDVHAAIARIQLERLEGFIQRRRMIARRYNTALKSTNEISTFPEIDCTVNPMYYRYIIKVKSRNRSRVMNCFQQNGIACSRPVFKPFHRYIQKSGYPVTDRLFNELLSIPIYPALTDIQCRRIEEVLSKIKN